VVVVYHLLTERLQQNTVQPPKEALVVLPYAGKLGEKIGKEENSTIKSIFQERMVVKLAFKAKKLSSCFNIKNRKLIQHKHDLVYKIMCPDCPATYIGETARRN